MPRRPPVPLRPRTPVPRARPGAAQSLPLQLVSRVPVIGRFARPAPPPEPRGITARLLSLGRKPAEASPRGLVASGLELLRAPVTRTARVMQVARDVRRPRTRWERLREAAQLAFEDPVAASRWDHLMSLGLGLVKGKGVPRQSSASRLSRLLALPARGHKKTGRGKPRGRS